MPQRFEHKTKETIMTTQTRTEISNESNRELTRKTRIMNYALWSIQTLLALLFLFAGGMKLVLPIEAMTQQMPMPGLFLRFIGVAEVLGGIGLILPWALRIRR